MLCALGVDVIFIKPIPKVKRGKCGGEGTENTSIVDIASQIVCVCMRTNMLPLTRQLGRQNTTHDAAHNGYTSIVV